MKTGTKLLFVKVVDSWEGPAQFFDFFLGGRLPFRIIGDKRNYYHPSVWGYVSNPDGADTLEYAYKLDENYVQYVSSDGRILPIYDAESLKQNLECRCAILKGELPYNTNLGVPLKLLPKETELAIVNLISTTYGVKSCIVKYRNFNSRMRKLDLQCEIQTIFGPINLTV